MECLAPEKFRLNCLFAAVFIFTEVCLHLALSHGELYSLESSSVFIMLIFFSFQLEWTFLVY